MIDAISKLVESGAISEDVQKSIQEAWDNKIKENKETVGAELREEFAKRYEHDKANMIEAIDKMMNEKLSEEISKFVEDRKALAQEKISYKENVGKHSAKLEEFILSKLNEELKSLKEDITAARTVNFGKKIFEAFASEYQNSYLNEKSESAKLMKVVDETTLKLKDAEKAIEEKQAVIESKEAESKRQADLMERKEKMAEMLKPLGKEKSEVMSQLLESVQTAKLQASFDKYLPHVMADKPIETGKKVISESKGDREQREDADITNIRKLAGI